MTRKERDIRPCPYKELTGTPFLLRKNEKDQFCHLHISEEKRRNRIFHQSIIQTAQ